VTQEKEAVKEAVKETIVEKRVSKRVIRRRKKKVVAAVPEPDKEVKEKVAVPDEGALHESSGEAVLSTKEKKEPSAPVTESTAEEVMVEAEAKGIEVATKAPVKEEEKKNVEVEGAFPGRKKATPEQIRRAIESSRARSAARKKGVSKAETSAKKAEKKQGTVEKIFGPSQGKKEIKVDIAASQAAIQKTESGRISKKRLRKEASFISREDQEKENRFNKKYRKKKATPDEEQKQTEITVPKASKRVIKINEFILIGELARALSVKSGEVIKKLMDLGVMATVNKSIDFDTAQIIASEFNYEVVNEAFQEEDLIKTGEDRPEDMVQRAPIVTVMGHVDHGKTTLLDAIRKTKVVEGEAGGITQHIGAYRVSKKIKDKVCDIVFIDTPGHEAFTAMRARGAQITDLVILVVAADDGIMPQTVEAINHAKAAKVPILVAINKIDKPDANIEKIKQSMTEFELVAEEWGGTTIYQEVSALKGTGIDELLEMITLQTEILELKANPSRNLEGIVVEGKLEKGRGPVATIIVKNGTVRVGDQIVCGVNSGRVRALVDDMGNNISGAGPSTPLEVIGLDGVPKAGDLIHSVDSERISKEVSEQRTRKARDAELMKSSKVSLEDLYKRIEEGDIKELNVVLKTDVQGTVDAILGGLEKLSTDKVRVKVIHGSVGAITETDVNLASASNAVIIGFNIRPSRQVMDLAVAEKVSIKTYTVIYELIDQVKKAMEGLLKPREVEKYKARIQIRKTFNVSRIGTIAGCYVLDGKVNRNDQVRVLRDSVVIFEGKLASLKRFKDDVKDVASGYECGLSIENFNDVKVDDEIETYVIEKIPVTL